jgi:short-subunit dehydrogenase
MAAKLVLITGASSGIGEATAKRYAASGARVLLLARNAERLDRVASAIKRAGGTAAGFPVDLADAKAVETVAAKVLAGAGVPDILINNAGAGRWLPFLDTTADEALAMIEVPYLAAFNLTRALLPPMLKRKSGALAFITSPASYIAWPNAAAYTAARRAMSGLADALRTELSGSGLSVTLVVLGTVESGYWEHNPGSRAHMPETSRLMPAMSSAQAAEAIFAGVAGGRRMVVKPAILRALFLLNAFAPGLVARQLRRATKRRGQAPPS